jgi:general secretion pathway protein G
VKYNKKRKAFTLVELLVVIAIIGLLVSLVGPKFFGQVDKAKEQTVKAQLQMISSALDAFRLDTGRYPTNEEGLKILWQKEASIAGFTGMYLPKPLKNDPWGHSYIYSNTNDNGFDYTLKSYGADGKEGGDKKNRDFSVWE